MPCGTYRNEYMTRAGYTALCAEIERLQAELRQKQTRSSDRAARSVGSTSMGCSAPDSVSQEHAILRNRITELVFQKNEVKVVDAPKVRDTVRIDTIVTLTYPVHLSRVRRRYHIVGYGEGHYTSLIPRIAYNAPLIKTFLGKEIGYKAEIKIDGKMRTVTVTGVHLPTDKLVARFEQLMLKKAA